MNVNLLLILKKKLISQESSDNNIVIKQKRIFISYSWDNKPIVRKLFNILTENKLICWIDESKINGGTQLFKEIENGISDCDAFIACCSNSYAISENCQHELELAYQRKKLIIPVLVAFCDPWPPKGAMGPLLAGKLYIDLSIKEKFDKTVDNLVTATNQIIY